MPDSIQPTIAFAAGRPEGAHTLALPLAPGAAPAGLGESAAALATAAIAAARFDGEAGALVELFADEGGIVRRLLLVGLGETHDGEKAGGALAARLLASGETRLVIDLSDAPSGQRATLAAALAEGALLRSWHHHHYRTRLPEKQKVTLAEIVIVAGDDATAAGEAWASRQAVVEGVALTRGLVAEPGNILYPESFVERCRHLADRGVGIEVLGEAEMRQAGMGALLGVSQGSAREAQLLVLTWRGEGAPDGPPTAFVGKGVTFDTGGISLKPGAGMEDMKFDMGGAAAVAGLMKALAGRQAPVHVVGICGLVENMPDGQAQRPGDIVTTMSGQTVEVINTDAEGRLVLCDALTWVQRRFAPKTIVDLATLTGAMIVSLGYEHGGLFANDDALADALIAAGRETGEKLWRMPLGHAYDQLIDSPIADMKNLGPREGGSITAAQFLQRYVEEGVRWAHLDIAGMAWAQKAGALWEKGATGYGVRLLERFVRDTMEG